MVMDKIKLIDEELRVLREYGSEDAKLCVSLRAIGGIWASSKIIGFQLLNRNGQCLLCMNNAAYVLEEGRVVRELFFGSSGLICHAYICIKNYPCSSGKKLSTQAFFLNDGSVEIYYISKTNFHLLRKIQLPETALLRTDHSECLTSCFKGSIYFSYDKHTLFILNLSTWQREANDEAIKEIYRTDLGELMFFGFLENGKRLLSVYKNVSTGENYVESSLFHKHNFFVTSRAKLGSRNGASIIWNQLTSDWIIGIARGETWSFKACSPPIKINNNGLIDELLPNLSSKIINSREASLEVYTRSGRVFTAVVSASSTSDAELKWVGRGSLFSKLHVLKDLEFVMPLYHEVYLVASNSAGISFHNKKRKIETPIKHCPYQRADFLDTTILPVVNPMANSYLLCGAYNKQHGFLQKRTIRCNFESTKTIKSKILLHSPVSAVWQIEGELVYESMGRLYSVHSDEEIEEFQDSIWCHRDGTIIKDEIGDIVSIAPLSKIGVDRNNSLVLLRKNGTIEITENMNGHSQVLFECKVKENIESTAVVAAYFDGQYHIVFSCQYNRLDVLCEKNLVYSAALTNEFIVSDIALKRIATKFYYVVTSMDGQCLVYTLESTVPLMQIKGGSKRKSYIFDFGQDSRFVLIYNRSECIVIDLLGEVYENLSFDVEPYQIRSYDQNGNNIYSFYILGYDWTLRLVEWDHNSTFRTDSCKNIVEVNNFDMGKSIPLRILQLGSNLSLVTLKNLSQFRLILFDSTKMAVLADYILGENCSNIIVRPLWSDVAKVDSFEDYILQKLILVHFVLGTKPCFQIFRIQDGKFVLQQTKPLLSPALTVFVDHEKMLVSFEGLQSQVYRISFVAGHEKVSLTHFERSPAALEIFQSNIQDMPSLATRLRRARLVANKQIDDELVFKKVEPLGYLSSLEIMQKFLGTDSRPEISREYIATVDYENYVNLAHISHRLSGGERSKGVLSSFCRFRLDSRILNISPAPYVSYVSHVMDVGCRSKSIDNIPLFVITCTSGNVFMLNEIIGSKVMRNKVSVNCSLSSCWEIDEKTKVACSMDIVDGVQVLSSTQSGT